MVHIISCSLLSGVSATYLSMTPMLMFLNVSTRAPLASASVFVGAFVVNLFVGISTGILTEIKLPRRSTISFLVIVGVLSRDDKTRTDSYVEAELAIKRRGSQTR